MPIKFACPSCKKALTARDEQGGKKVTCPACKKPLFIPKASPQLPAMSAEDLEASAAAAWSDAQEQAATPETIDFTCENCEAELKFPLAEAGKRHPCPECRRIIKVPVPAKADPTNWRKKDTHLPSAARRPDEPAPEGAWGNVTKTVVSRESLKEADAIPDKPRPLTVRQRIAAYARTTIAVVVVVGLGIFIYGRISAYRAQRAITAALQFAGSPEALTELGPEGVAALHTLAGTYYLHTQQSSTDAPLANQAGSAEQAQIEYQKALSALQSSREPSRSNERDAALADLALAVVELGGDGDAARDKLRIKWEKTQQLIQATLNAMRSPEIKLNAFRDVVRKLIEHGEAKRVQSLAAGAFDAASGAQLAGQGIVGLALLDQAQDTAKATQIVEQVTKAYDVKEHRPPLAASAVALCLALNKPAPKSGNTLQDDENSLVGEVEGLARKGAVGEARAKMKAALPAVQIRCLLRLADVTKDKASEELTQACQLAEGNVPDRGRESALLYRLVQVGSRASVAEARLSAVAGLIEDPFLRGRARLELCRAQLAHAAGSADVALADAVDARTPAAGVARAELARHNARHSSGYLSTAQSWPGALSAFGTIGALQGRQSDLAK